MASARMRTASIGGGWLDYVADSWKPKSAPFASTSGDREGTDINTGGIGTLLLPRRVPLKVEPKVFLANERTFLAWLHVCLMLAGASLTIVTFSRDETIVNQLYGIVLLPVSVAYIFYALWQCKSQFHSCSNFIIFDSIAHFAHFTNQSFLDG